jgi:hypothetical protein
MALLKWAKEIINHDQSSKTQSLSEATQSSYLKFKSQEIIGSPIEISLRQHLFWAKSTDHIITPQKLHCRLPYNNVNSLESNKRI